MLYTEFGRKRSSIPPDMGFPINVGGATSNRSKKENEDIMSVLLQHEKQSNQKDVLTKSLKYGSSNADSSDSSDDDKDIDNTKIREYKNFSKLLLFYNCYKKQHYHFTLAKVDYNNYINSESEDDDDDVPTVLVAGRPHPIDQINDEFIAQMTQQEKENYIHVYQQHYSHIYD